MVLFLQCQARWLGLDVLCMTWYKPGKLEGPGQLWVGQRGLVHQNQPGLALQPCARPPLASYSSYSGGQYQALVEKKNQAVV